MRWGEAAMEDVTAEEAAEWGELQRKRRGKEGTRKEREAAERRFLEAHGHGVLDLGLRTHQYWIAYTVRMVVLAAMI
eukprot:COSAG03_NODE_942_length_5250_cov_946.264415_1_plen_77_part_00